MRTVKLGFGLLLLAVASIAFGQANPGGNTYVPFPPTNITSPANNQCLVYQSSSARWVNGSCSSGGGVTVTGSPANGNLAFFSGAGTISNGNLSGDCNTSGTGVLTCTRINGTAFSGLSTGILKNTTGTGVPSIAVAGTDYQVPITAYSQLPTIASGTILGNSSGSTAAPSALTAPTVTSINTTSTTAPYQYGGNAVLQFPLDNTSEYQVWVGPSVGVGSNPAAVTSMISVCVGSHACGSSGAGMSGAENTAIGWSAMALMTTGGFNASLGAGALWHETTGTGNVAIGSDTMRDPFGNTNSTAVGYSADKNMILNNSTAVGAFALDGGLGTTASASTLNNDTAVGAYALEGQLTTTGGNNTAVGATALWSTAATTDHDNVAVGYQALGSASLTTAAGNVAIGSSALAAITTTSNNVGVGPSVLQFNTSGTNNTAIGNSAAQNATADTSSIAIGALALQGQTSSTGNANIAIGSVAMGQSTRTSAIQDVAIGNNSMQAITTGSNNVALGWHTGQVLTTGANNVLIGQATAGATLTTGGSNILIGSAIDALASGTSNEINIGGLVFLNNNSTAPPAVSACGTSPAIDAHANNRSGTVTVGSGTVASCTVTLAGTGYNTWNHCRVTPQQSDAGFAYSYTKTVITVTATSLTSEVFDYDCDGY